MPLMVKDCTIPNYLISIPDFILQAREAIFPDYDSFIHVIKLHIIICTLGDKRPRQACMAMHAYLSHATLHDSAITLYRHSAKPETECHPQLICVALRMLPNSFSLFILV